MQAQARRVFENLGTALGAVGAGFGDVVMLDYYIARVSQVGSIRTVGDEYVDTERPPTSTDAEVIRLFRENLLVTVEAVLPV